VLIHVLAYLKRVLRSGPADWRRHADVVVAGARSRRLLLSATLLAGVILALAIYPVQQFHGDHGQDDRRVQAPPR
jgi:hypothetical protein